MQQMIAVNSEVSMTSVAFLKNIITPARIEYGEPAVENRHFLSRVEDEIDELGVAETFYVTTEQGASRGVKGYMLNMEQMTLIRCAVKPRPLGRGYTLLHVNVVHRSTR